MSQLWNLIANVPRGCGRALVKAYRYTLSPLIGFHCRYLPTCSEYADRALERHGLWAGGWMTLAQAAALPPLGQFGTRLCPGCPAAERTLVSAVALRPLARNQSGAVSKILRCHSSERPAGRV